MAAQRKFFLIALLLVFLLALVFIRPAFAQGRAPDVDWRLISSGGGSASASGLSLNASLGQPVTGASSASGQSLTSGFWQGISRMMIWLPLLLR
jgi:hypothetical protein